MSEMTICKYNQKGYCKFKTHCMNIHENSACQEQDACNTKECIYRHPKFCRNFSWGKSCKFGEDCAYKHKENNSIPFGQEIENKHFEKIYAIQNEVTLLKSIISRMENIISELIQEVEIGQKTNIEEIVKLVVSMMDSFKQSVESFEAEHEENSEAQCDQCSYKCENEDMLINHMSKKHENCYSCNLCAEYFVTNTSLEFHNSYFHNLKNSSSESESEEVEQKDKERIK